MGEFLSDVGFNKGLKRQITRGDSEGGSEMPGNMSEFGLGKIGEATVIEPDQSCTLKTETPVNKPTGWPDLIDMKNRASDPLNNTFNAKEFLIWKREKNSIVHVL